MTNDHGVSTDAVRVAAAEKLVDGGMKVW